MHRNDPPAPRILPAAGLLVILLLPLAPHAVAEPVAGSFRSSGTTFLDGPHALEWDLVGASLRTPEGGNGSALVHLHDVSLRWINVPYTVLTTQAGVADQEHASYGDQQVLFDRATTGTLQVHLQEDAQEVRILPGAHTLRIASNATAATIHPAGALLAPPAGSNVQGLAFVQEIDLYIQGPHTHARTPGLSLHDATTALLVPAGTVWLPGETTPRQAGRSLNESSSLIDPVTRSGRYVYDNHVLLLTGGRIHIETDGLDWHLAATHTRGLLDGTARWQGIVGAIAINGTRTQSDPSTLEVAGDLRVASDLRETPMHWRLDGQAIQVSLDNEPFWQAPAAVTSLGLLATLLAILASGTLRGAITVVLGRSTPALVKATLDSPSRKRILQAIHAHQPVRPADLARLTGLSRSSLRYHLRVLDAHDVLQAHVPPGQTHRATTLMLNSGSHTFQTTALAALVQGTPRATVHADRALAAAHGHPLRRALHDALCRDGPGDYHALHDRLRVAGIDPDLPRSKASYHLGILCEAGAVASQWVDGHKVYEANLDPDAVRAKQYCRYLGQHHALGLVQTLARRDLARSEVLDLLQGPGRSRRHARTTLQELIAVAILEPAATPDRFRLTPPLQTLAPTLRTPA